MEDTTRPFCCPVLRVSTAHPVTSLHFVPSGTKTKHLSNWKKMSTHHTRIKRRFLGHRQSSSPRCWKRIQCTMQVGIPLKAPASKCKGKTETGDIVNHWNSQSELDTKTFLLHTNESISKLCEQLREPAASIISKMWLPASLQHSAKCYIFCEVFVM